MIKQSENERDTRRGVTVDPQAEVTNTAAGAKSTAAAAARSEAAAGTGRAGTAGAPPGTTRSTGQTQQQSSSSSCDIMSKTFCSETFWTLEIIHVLILFFFLSDQMLKSIIALSSFCVQSLSEANEEEKDLQILGRASSRL